MPIVSQRTPPGFYDVLSYQGQTVSAFAVAMARAISAGQLERSVRRPCFHLYRDGSVEAVPVLGTSSFEGRLCLCIAKQTTTAPITEASLEELGGLIQGLAIAIEAGRLLPGQIDPSSIRLLTDGYLLLSPAEPGQGQASESSYLLDLNRALASLAHERLSIQYPDRATGQQSTPDQPPRTPLLRPPLPRVYQGRSILDSRVRRFLLPDLKAKPTERTALWKACGQVLQHSSAYYEASGPQLALGTFLDRAASCLWTSKTWLRAHRLAISTVLAVSIFAVSLGLPMLRKNLGPPASAGMSPETLARSFFTAVNELDLGFIDSVLRRPSASPFGDSLYALAVATRLREGLPAQSARLVEERSMPVNDAPDAWGAENLHITSVDRPDEDTAIIKVAYTWQEGGRSENRQELLTMKLRRGHWIIHDHRPAGTLPGH